MIAVLVAAAVLCAGCGGSHAASGITLGSILKRAGPDIGVTAGASEFVPGRVRFPFLVIDSSAKPVYRPRATVWVARSQDGTPFARLDARLEPIGIPGHSQPAFGGVTRIYVLHVRIPRAGRYWLVAQPVGARVQALGAIDVHPRSRSVAGRARAPRSGTPALAPPPAAGITTRNPPDPPPPRY